MRTTNGKTPLIIHAAAAAHTLKGWGSHAPVAKKSNRTPDLTITGRNIPGHKGSIHCNAILAGTVT